MDVAGAAVAVVGVAGTLGAALLTQRGAERAKRRELELARGFQEARESLALRRECYTRLYRDARQFATALTRHLHVLRERRPDEGDVRALEEAKDAHRNHWSETLMVAPDAVIAPGDEANQALTRVYGMVKRLEQDNARPGESVASAARAQDELWPLIKALRHAMRQDLGVGGEF
ncbi:hypothetical protein PUR71_02145 [Streptomyces sp. SP17BM10]|uniref:hypothetical protein n=1 Tax=Streptomyces sp. SP17BM10 TaxID=3002530 RepID=UPI002E76609B|nr:hypothetical protein [Streptomyces sp. SP17BM10]MEE1781739.1 hypothetical protein [Streptomyces sp. SP17BM10]